MSLWSACARGCARALDAQAQSPICSQSNRLIRIDFNRARAASENIARAPYYSSRYFCRFGWSNRARRDLDVDVDDALVQGGQSFFHLL